MKVLVFFGKAVMVQGTASTIQYPETVGTTGRYKVYQTLPIVCGIFESNNTAPGTVGPVVEGQDTPAPAGAGEYYPDYSGSGSGSGSNRTGEGENTGEENPDP